jgi:hypothetical protein
MVIRFLVLVSLLGAVPTPATGQETRLESITTEQADKATRLMPYEQHWSETLLLNVRKAIIEQPAGFFPYFDSVYNGGGFTLGGGYRYFTGDRTQLNVAGLYSAKGYKLIRAAAASPGHLSGHVDVRATALWRDATQVDFYGLGVNSPADANAAFRMQQTYVGGDLTVRPNRWLLFTAATGYEDYTIKEPTGTVAPVDDAFTPDTAPGLGVNPTYLHTATAAAVDWRPAAEYARRGGLYRVEHHHYADSRDTYTFSRVDTELVQHLPILRENWVISLRGRLESTVGDDSQVPYFLLPALGSGSTLRGYSSFRFRDRHALLLSGEWRWIPNRMALDMAIFYDTGMVAARLDQLAMNTLVSNVGVGVRFHGPAQTPLRIEVARGSEGTRVVFAASAAF